MGRAGARHPPYLRADGESNLAQIGGSGVTKAGLLTRPQSVGQSRALSKKYPGQFVWFVSADVTKQHEPVAAAAREVHCTGNAGGGPEDAKAGGLP